MIINDEHKLMFIHIYKTGGSLFTYSYIDIFYCDELNKQLPGWQFKYHKYGDMHLTFKDLEKKESIEKYKNYKKIVIVRNPYDWLLSIWNDFCSHIISFKGFINEIKIRNEEYINRNKPISTWDLGRFCVQRQYDFISNSLNLNIDKIIKFEDIKDELTTFFKEYSDKEIILPKISSAYFMSSRHKKSGRNYKDYYDDSMYNIVNIYFRKDFEHFGYEMKTVNPVEFKYVLNTSKFILNNLEKCNDLIDIKKINTWVLNYKGSIFLDNKNITEELYHKYEVLKNKKIKPLIVISHMDINGNFVVGSEDQLKKLLKKIDSSVNVVSYLDVNWGYLSGSIKDRTVEWGILSNSKMNSIKSIFRKNNNDIKYKLFVSQHRHGFINGHIYNIENIPIGFDLNHINLDNILEKVKKYANLERSKLIICHCNMTINRKKLFYNILNVSDVELVNEKVYGEEYYKSLSSSKYILCMSGLGFDCYRIWEALLFGCVPVVESIDDQHGLHAFFKEFPILQVKNFGKVFPSKHTLNQKYLELSYKFEIFEKKMFTNNYWIKEFTKY